jgi:propanol-preferring alcohol dehydrogenase
MLSANRHPIRSRINHPHPIILPGIADGLIHHPTCPLRTTMTRSACWVLIIGLFGFGASASQAIEVLRHWNCEVYVSTRGETHRQQASSAGATWVGAEDDKPPVELDRAITFAPSGAVVVSALSSLRKGGIVAINAIHLDQIPAFDYDKLLWGERQIRSVANMTRQDAFDYLQLAGQIGIKPQVQVFPLTQANEALQAVKHETANGPCVIVPGASQPIK